MIWTFFKLIKKKISSSYCPIVTVIRIGCLRFFFSFVHCWFFEESNSVEITLNTFLRLLYKYMVQKLLDLTRALFITTKIHTPRWRLQKFKGNFYFRSNHIRRAAPRTDNSLVTQAKLQRRLNQMELRSMDSYNQIFSRFQKYKRKVLPPSPLFGRKKKCCLKVYVYGSKFFFRHPSKSWIFMYPSIAWS